MSHHSKHHHHHNPKHHLSSAGTHDSHGWVEGITALKESDGAVALLGGGSAAPLHVAAQQQPTSAPDKQLHAHAPAGAPSSAGAAAVPTTTNGSGPSTAHAAAAAVTAAGAGAVTAGDAAAANSNATGMPTSTTTAPPTVAEPTDFQSCVDKAVDMMRKEVTEVGEVVLEVGGAAGWGPQGLDAQGASAAFDQIKAAAATINAACSKLRERTVQLQTPNGPVDSCVADVLVRKLPGSVATPIEVRVAIIGNVDSGKSTMVGVLTRSMLDDGRGLARSKVFKHHHEESTGRTSSIGQHTLCLDAAGGVLNDASFRNQTCADYIARSSKVITLVDLAGHEKYFRTTAYGLTGHMPDYACLIVGANMGVVGMCKEHMGVALALKVPVFFVVTKVDICPEHILKQTVQNLTTILKKPGVRKKPYLVRNMDDVLLCARNMHTDSLAPVFLTSAVTGKGLDLVRMFYNLLLQRQRWSEMQSCYAEFVVDETFGVPGVGTVVAGTVKKGVITPNMTLMLGPDIADASFKPVAIKSIHYKRLPVQQVVAGQTAALALKRVKRSQVRKGMVLVDERLKPAASWEFDADIAILTHSTTIQPRYQAVIHCEIIRQAARVVAMDCERLRSGDRAAVRFRFIQRPEYVTLNTRFVFREGRTKGIGIIIGNDHEQLPLPPPPSAGGGAAGAEEEQAAGTTTNTTTTTAAAAAAAAQQKGGSVEAAAVNGRQ